MKYILILLLLSSCQKSEYKNGQKVFFTQENTMVRVLSTKMDGMGGVAAYKIRMDDGSIFYVKPELLYVWSENDAQKK